MNCAAVRLELAVQYLFKGTVLLTKKTTENTGKEDGREEKGSTSSQCAGSGTESFWVSRIPDYLYRSGS
jgi:hypothetical protein